MVHREEVRRNMRNYESMVVFKPELEDAAYDALIARLGSVVTDGGGEVVKTDRWGRRRLAYEIKGFRDGFYTVLEFKGEPAVARELERILKITDDVIRYLIVRKGG